MTCKPDMRIRDPDTYITMGMEFFWKYVLNINMAVHPGNITYGDSVHAHMLTVSVRTITICDYAHAHFDHHA